jgi:hypothetical protein
MMTTTLPAWSGFKQIIAEYWDGFKRVYPRYDRRYYDGLVEQDARVQGSREDGDIEYRCLEGSQWHLGVWSIP